MNKASVQCTAPAAPLAVCLGLAMASARATEPYARCHGGDAEGTDRAPDLRRRVGGMSQERFVATVL